MAVPSDPTSGLPLDPVTLQALQQQQMVQSLGNTGGTARERLNDLSAAQATTNLFPSQQVQQSTSLQNALKQAQVTQNDGESDLDFSLRQLKAQRDAVASQDPQAANAINTQMLKLGQVKFEQSRLIAQDQRTQTEFNDTEPDKAARASADLAQEKATGKLAYAITPDKSELGYSAKAYDLTDPTQSQAYQDAVKAGAYGMPADKAAALFQSSNTADMKVAGELAKAQMTSTNGKLDPQAVPQLAVESVFDPSVLSRVSGAARSQIGVFKTQSGITPLDELEAKTQIRAIQTAASAEGRRDGNITLLQNSMQGMGSAVLNALQGVDRTSFTGANAVIAAGKTWASNGPEKAYQGAIQSFVNDYARVVNGGTGQSSEGARKEAWALLSKADGPEAVTAAVHQLASIETDIIKKAGDQSIEMLARPNQYTALAKIQQKAGIKIVQDQGDQEAANNPSQAPLGTLPPSALAALKAGQNTTFKNGQVWTLKNGAPVRVQ